jgi:hypothetical protein
MKPLFILLAGVIGFNYLYEFNPGVAVVLGLFTVVVLYYFETE